MAYRLKLPDGCLLHPVFHVSQLRDAKGAARATSELPPQVTKELEMVVEPEAVLGIRPGTGKHHGESEVLIQWKGLPPLEATWEVFSLLQRQFPSFHLEDKVTVLGGSNDRPPVQRMYQRRPRNRE